VRNMADKTRPTSVPATPKREVRRVAAGEAIPTARILGKSMMDWLCGELNEAPSYICSSSVSGYGIPSL
jgi:hypothetical protein